jgi:KDO2-lipid IV(A) lauroyltransferase
MGYRLHVVAGVQMNRLLTGALREFKEHRGITVVNPHDSYRQLYRALGANGIVALLLDGDIFRGGSAVTLFGRRAELPNGAVRLARGTGAPIIGAYCRNTGGSRHFIHVEPIIGFGEIEGLSDAEALEHVSRAAERFIGANYDQWCVFRDFWGATH